MSQVFTNPVILSLLLINVVAFCLLSIYFLEQKRSLGSTIETACLVIFILSLSETTLFPFSHLKPASLAMATTQITSFTAIFQISCYSLMIFLCRRSAGYLNSGIKYLLKHVFLSALLLTTVLSTLWSETPFETFRASLVLLGIALVAAWMAAKYSFSEIARIFRIVGTCIVVAGLPIVFLVPSIGNSEIGWRGVLAHKNGFGAWSTLTCALWIEYAIREAGLRKSTVLPIILSLITLLGTAAGNASLMFLTMLFVLGIFHVQSRLKSRHIPAVLSFIAAFGFSFAIWLRTNKEILVGAIGKDLTLTGRTDFWPQVIGYIQERPILGYGYEGFWQQWRGDDNPANSIVNPGGFIPPNAHNGFLEIILATGVVGISIFCLSLLTCTVLIWKLMEKGETEKAKLAILLLIFSLFTSISESNIWIINTYTFVHCLASIRLCKDVTDSRRLKKLKYGAV